MEQSYVIFREETQEFFAGYDTGTYGSGYPRYSQDSALIYQNKTKAEELCAQLSKYDKGLAVKELQVK